jgi:hypothetical protein
VARGVRGGVFTEFMEQRAPGHTVLDDKIYRRGLLDLKRDIAAAIAALDFATDPTRRRTSASSWTAMDIACDAVICSPSATPIWRRSKRNRPDRTAAG